MPRGKRKVQQPASGGGRARRGRKSAVEEEEDSSSEGEDVNEGSVPEEPLTQFTQLSQLEEEDDDSNELWKNGDEFGPMETEIEDLVEWRPLTSSEDSDLVDIPQNVHEACVKWVTKYFLAESMQQQNRSVIDLYEKVAKQIRDYAGASFGMTAKTGKKRALKREDIDNIFVEAARRLRVFYGFKLILLNGDLANSVQGGGGSSAARRKLALMGRIIVVSSLNFDKEDSTKFRRMLKRSIHSVGGQRQARLAFYSAVIALVTLELKVESARLWQELKRQKWFSGNTHVHPQLGNLDEILSGMQSEGFIRTIETHDQQGEVTHQMVLGWRAAVEIGLDALVDLVEQVYMTNNHMPENRSTRRKQMKLRIQNQCLNAESD